MSEQDWKCCGSVILYNPTEAEIKGLCNYLTLLDKLFIYDNSLVSQATQLTQFIDAAQFVYVHDPSNAGISKAYNQLVDLAVLDGYSHMLLLDQDSVMSQASLAALLAYSQSDGQSALYAPRIIFMGNQDQIDEKVQAEIEEPLVVKDISFAITSGSIVDLAIYKKLGGYDENLFIDGVDRDYCLRLKQNGYRMVEIANARLYQVLGDGTRNLFGVYEHSPIRNYYIFRNRLYLIKKYPALFSGASKFYHLQLSSLKQLGSVLFFESQKKQKLHYITLAWQDYKNAKFAKIQHTDN